MNLKIKASGKYIKKIVSGILVIIVAVSSYIYLNTSPPKDIELKTSDVTLAQVIDVKIEGISARSFIYAGVERVVDGDTLKVSYNGEDYRVRLLDVDTPESVKQGVAVQPYSKEASAYTANKCNLKTVKLVFEKDIKDKYGRLLAYVVLPDGTLLNELLVKNGYARIEIISPNTLLKKFFQRLQDAAIAKKTGLWSLPENKQPFVLGSNGEYIPSYY
ncbi:MAG: thermonuclease family protein [Clostridia bacterium]